MNNFKKYNLIFGWFSFLFAAVVYILTTEPSASLWDCAEFIATSYKMEVGHPPGAPLFMMIARFFTIFAPNPAQAALMVNVMSCLASAATILFLFWSITHLARKAYRKSETELSNPQIGAIMGAGLIGAIAYTFTDTFWFSAVEGEVYALSSMFTALVFWAILKWENVADEPHSNRWLILIAYFTGLGIGVHLLNLLIIPCIVFIYYFKKYPVVTKWGIFKALLVSGALIVAILYIIIPYTVKIGAFIDRIFVNGMGFPVNLGFGIYIFALIGAIIWGVYYTHKKGKVLANTIVLCFGVILLGYGSYASVIIRSAVNPPMNSNAPNNPYGLFSLLNRDQYGDRPIVRGPYYSSKPINIESRTTYWENDEGKYVPGEILTGYNYPSELTFFFPRMYDPRKEAEYKNWVDIQGRQIPYRDEMITVPTFGENMQFFFGYQLNFMYWRYFLWNFVGRQSDIQSTGEITDGNWLSGIKAIDELYLGPQDNLPSEKASNRGNNKYYFLPFILGIVGLLFQLKRDGKNFTVVMLMFIMTGIAISVYLNSPTAEPRERDYVYAGSFYAFAIWIGFGVLAIYEAIKRWFKKESLVTAAAATAICCVVPGLLGAQNWDDHNRSHRYVARDFGRNALNTCLPNSIYMNYGDNDTFPMWYAQEVENVRPDVRIMNLTYLSGEWYVDQMRHKYNESEPVPFSLPREKYMFKNETVMVMNRVNGTVPIKDVINFVTSDVQNTMHPMYNIDYIPATKIALPVNKENAILSGIVKPEDAHLIEDTITITLKDGGDITRSTLMLLDLLANFDWKRPLYFSSILQTITELGLRDYMQLDGFGYRFVPIKTQSQNILEAGRVDTDYLYEKLMNEFDYGNVGDPRVYTDFTVHNVFNSTYVRNTFARLATTLAVEGNTERAIEVLDRCQEKMPFSQIRHNIYTTEALINAYYTAGAFDKGNTLLNSYVDILEEYVDYYMRFTGKKAELVQPELEINFHSLYRLLVSAERFGQETEVERIESYLTGLGIL